MIVRAVTRSSRMPTCPANRQKRAQPQNKNCSSANAADKPQAGALSFEQETRPVNYLACVKPLANAESARARVRKSDLLIVITGAL